MLRAETRDVAQLPFGYLTELSSVAASEFRRPVGAGPVVSPDDREPERCVRRGHLVTLIGRAAGIEVGAAGQDMAEGGRCSSVPVQTRQQGRRVRKEGLRTCRAGWGPDY